MCELVELGQEMLAAGSGQDRAFGRNPVEAEACLSPAFEHWRGGIFLSTRFKPPQSGHSSGSH